MGVVVVVVGVVVVVVVAEEVIHRRTHVPDVCVCERARQQRKAEDEISQNQTKLIKKKKARKK